MAPAVDNLEQLLRLLQSRRDATGCLSALAPLFAPLKPRLLLLADAEGEVCAVEDLLGDGRFLESDRLLGEKVAARLRASRSCVFPYPDEHSALTAFGLRVDLPEGRYVLGGLVEQAAELPRLLKRRRKVLTACVRLACTALHYHQQWSEATTANQHLRAEHTTLKAAHTEAVLEAIREREERLAVESHRWALEEFLCAAEKANRSKSEFLASVSHELRTPMTAMLGYADLLLERLEDPQDLEAATTIKRNGEFLLQILDDILDISKIEAGKLEVHREPCPLLEIVGDVVSLMGVRAKAKRLPLIVDLHGPLPETIVTDSTRVRQILLNLLGNALKFTEAGEVRLRVQLVDACSEEPRVRFDVMDTGIGMSPEQVEGLFQPFYQIDSPHNRQYRGTGLGLAISRRLTEMLGGQISVTSTLGRGSTFTFTIAAGSLEGVKLIDNPTLPASRPRAGRRGLLAKLHRSCRILLVEDSPDNQRLISHMLRKAGAEVETAENGLVGLQKVRAQQAVCEQKPAKTRQGRSTASAGRKQGGQTQTTRPFDVILMDVEMPVMDGRQATRRLREQGFDGPIIALTAHAMQHEIESCLAAGCDAHVAKPIDWPTLIETIQAELGRRRPGGNAAASSCSDAGNFSETAEPDASAERPAGSRSKSSKPRAKSTSRCASKRRQTKRAKSNRSASKRR